MSNENRVTFADARTRAQTMEAGIATLLAAFPEDINRFHASFGQRDTAPQFVAPVITQDALHILAQIKTTDHKTFDTMRDKIVLMSFDVSKPANFDADTAYTMWLEQDQKSPEERHSRTYLHAHFKLAPEVIITKVELADQLNILRRKPNLFTKPFIPRIDLKIGDENKKPPWKLISAQITLSQRPNLLKNILSQLDLKPEKWGDLSVDSQIRATETYMETLTPTA